MKRSFLAACLLALMATLPGVAAASFMLPPQGYRAKDFTLIRHDGLYHLFYIRNKLDAPLDSTENDFGHAVSTDLISWTQLDPVLPVRPGNWDNLHVWAPHIVESDSVFYMFYTGVTRTPGVYFYYQRIGVATSTDLMTWNRLDAPVLSCEDVPWAFCNPLSGYTAFRDPFVMEDPQSPGNWWMLFSTSLAQDSTSMIQGVASAQGPDQPWSNAGRLWITNQATTGSQLSESAHMFEHDGYYFLLWTTNKTEPIVWATSPNPGPFTAWTYRGTLGSMLGFDTSPWFASEHLRDGLVDYFAAASLTALEILRMQWTGPTSFQLVQPSPFHVRAMTWSRPVVDVGDTASLTIQCTSWYGNSASIEVLEVDSTGVETPVPAFQVGLPDAIPMTSNTTVFNWTAHDYPDPNDGLPGPELLVRMKDQTAAAQIIRVVPGNPAPQPPGPFDGVSEGFLLRFLARSPLGASFRIDLPGAGAAHLDLFDVSGRRIGTLHDGPLSSGTTVIPLGGVLRGRAPGVYFARLQTPAGRRTVRFVFAP